MGQVVIFQGFLNGSGRYLSGLSKWVRSKMRFFDTFRSAQSSLEQFTKERLDDAGKDLNTRWRFLFSDFPRHLVNSSKEMPQNNLFYFCSSVCLAARKIITCCKHAFHLTIMNVFHNICTRISCSFYISPRVCVTYACIDLF